MRHLSLLLLLVLGSTIIVESRAQTELYFNQEILGGKVEDNIKINIEHEKWQQGIRGGYILYGGNQLFNTNFTNWSPRQIAILRKASVYNFYIESCGNTTKFINFPQIRN